MRRSWPLAPRHATLQAPDVPDQRPRLRVHDDRADRRNAATTRQSALEAVRRHARGARAQEGHYRRRRPRAGERARWKCIGREQREEPTGSFGGKSVTGWATRSSGCACKSGEEESDLKGMGLGTWARAAKDAAERFLKWIARREPKRDESARRIGNSLDRGKVGGHGTDPLRLRHPCLSALATRRADREAARHLFHRRRGGQATLFVTPSGESMLIDTGYPGFKDRDINRVARGDETGGTDEARLAAGHALPQRSRRQRCRRSPRRFRSVTFIDHGETVETDQPAGRAVCRLPQGTRDRPAPAGEAGRQGPDPRPRHHDRHGQR